MLVTKLKIGCEKSPCINIFTNLLYNLNKTILYVCLK